VGAGVWLFLQDFLQGTLDLGASWKLVLGLVFVLLVCFLRQGIIGGIRDLWRLGARKRAPAREPAAASAVAPGKRALTAMPARHRASASYTGPILEARGLSKRYGGVVANADIDFTVRSGEVRGIIGPNGAGKTTLFKMLTCEVAPSSGTIRFEGHDIAGMSITEVCQLGLTKSYQINQLFNRLSVRENVTIAALAELRGKFRLDLLRSLDKLPGLRGQVEHTLELVDLSARRDTPVAELAYGEKRRLEVGLALASSPSLLLL